MTLDAADTDRKIRQLSEQGYCCSQVLVTLALERQNKTNWDFVRGMEGLKGGFGCFGDICGTLTGAICLMGLYGGRGPVDENPDLRLDPMVRDLVVWFRDEIGQTYGGIKCDQITAQHSDQEMLVDCRSIMLRTYLEATRLLENYGFNVESGRGENFSNHPSESNE